MSLRVFVLNVQENGLKTKRSRPRQKGKFCNYRRIVLKNKKRSRIVLERFIFVFSVNYQPALKSPCKRPILSDTRVFLSLLKQDF